MKYLCLAALLLLIACAPPTKPTEEGVAVLNIMAGHVLVNDAPARSGQELREGDAVKTAEGSKAAIVFFDSSILRLDEKTELTVKGMDEKNHSITLKQSVGSTWSRVLRVSGILGYRIETPNTVATVRGTGFAVKIKDGDTMIIVKEGKVHVASYEDGAVIAEALVVEDKTLEVADDALAVMELEEAEVDTWADENLAEDQAFMEEVAEDFAEDHPELMEDLREDGLSEDEIEEWLDDLMTGDLTEEELSLVSAEEQGKMQEEGVVIEAAEEPVEELPVEEEVVIEPEEYIESEPAVETQPAESTDAPEENTTATQSGTQPAVEKQQQEAEPSTVTVRAQPATAEPASFSETADTYYTYNAIG